MAGDGAHGEDEVGVRQHPEGNSIEPRVICLFYHRLFSESFSGVCSFSVKSLVSSMVCISILHFSLKTRIVTLI